MGEQLLEKYQIVKQRWGLKAQVRLAVITRMAAPSAAKALDSQENLAKFNAAIKEIAKEYESQEELE